MKQFKPVLICAAVLIVISIAAVALMKLIPENQSPAENPENENLPLSESIMITESSADEVESVESVSDEGKSFVIDYSDDTFGRRATMRNADPRLSYSEYEMSLLSQYLGKLVALEEAGTGEASLFGFDKPQRTIKIRFTGGDTVTLLLGSALPVGEGVYIKRTDRDTVYTIGKNVSEVLLRDMSDYRDAQLFKQIESTELITMAEYTSFGKKPIKVIRRSEEEIKKDAERTSLSFYYKLVSPISANAASEMIGPEFLDKIINIKALRVVEDFPEDLKKYGLDKPSRLCFETSTGVFATLLIGEKTEDGGTFVMLEGVPSVLETKKDVSLSSLSVSDITWKLLWFFTPSEVSSFEYKLENGEKHTLSLDVSEQKTGGTYDGKELPDSDAQNLFLRTVRFALAGECSPGEKYASPSITITAKFTNGKTSTLSLCKINERQYAAVIDGKAAYFYVPVSEVRELTEAFELLAGGKNIPDMF